MFDEDTREDIRDQAVRTSATLGKAPETPIRAALRSLTRSWLDKLVQDNEALRLERNNRRWYVERDPVQYESYKAELRAQYAQRIRAEEGREVRTYERIPGKTVDDHAENVKARKTAQRRDQRAQETPEQREARKDRDAFEKWHTSKLEAGLTEDEIFEMTPAYEAARAARKAKKAAKAAKAEVAEMEADENFGMFSP